MGRFNKYIIRVKPASDLDITILALTINLVTMRIAIPYLEYPFMLIFIVFIFRAIRVLFHQKHITDLISFYIRNYYLYILVSLGYFTGLLFTKHFSILVIREAAVAIIFLIVTFFFNLYINNPEQFRKFKHQMLIQIKYISIFAASLGIIKFISLLYGHNFKFLYQQGLYPIGTSLKLDHNFSSLASFLGLISIYYLNKEVSLKKIRVWDNLFIFILVIHIVLSSSRRAIALLIIGPLFMLAVYRISYLKVGRIDDIYKSTRNFILSSYVYIFAIIALGFLIIRYNNRVLNILEISPSILKEQITSIVYDYSTIISETSNRDSIYNYLWKPKFDPLDPSSGWGRGVHKEVRMLQGNNKEIVPSKAIGYVIDSTMNAFSQKNRFYHSVSIKELRLSKNQILAASIYCFVDTAFNGDYIRFTASKDTYRKNSTSYNLKEKGKWQKLNITASSLSEKEKVVIRLLVVKNPSEDFEGLNGNVIIAYPDISLQQFDPLNPDSGWGYLTHQTIDLEGKLKILELPGSTKGYKIDKNVEYYVWGSKTTSATVIYMPLLSKSDYADVSIYCYVSSSFNGSSVILGSNDKFSIGSTRGWYNLNQKATWQKLEIEFQGRADTSYVPVFLAITKKNATSFDGLKGYVVWAYPQMKIKYGDATRSFIEGDSEYRNIPSRIEPTLTPIDSSQELETMGFRFPLEKIIRKDSALLVLSENHLFGNRYDRWRFALQYYKDYSTFHKLFGNGFDYIPAFGKFFFDDKEHMDYPHNPIIAALLYAGLIGGLIYIVFLLQTFYLYYHHSKILAPFFMFYLITFYFSFFSGNSHFELPLFTFLSILPFCLNYIIQKR